jgi:phosphoribosylformylglycinamidine synthase subunit PurS
MIYTAYINIMPLKELLDPQGKAVQGSLQNLGMGSIQDVRIGKHITLQIEASSAEDAKAIATQACEKMLCNAVMETFDVRVSS